MVALDVLLGILTGEEWWERVSGLTITAEGLAGDGRRTVSPGVCVQLSNQLLPSNLLEIIILI